MKESLADVRDRITRACLRARRDPGEVGIVAVSKTYPPEAVRAAVDAGQLVFGENRVQEAKVKIPLSPVQARWHLIGHLQKNKIRAALPLFELIHGVDTLELAGEIDRISADLGLFPRILLQVNVSGEGSKFGFPPDRLLAGLEFLLGLKRVEIAGLMTMAPFSEDPEEARPHFRVLRELRGEMEARIGGPLEHLSMGMSGDFEVAVGEGATLVRVGSAIFGERKRVAVDDVGA